MFLAGLLFGAVSRGTQTFDLVRALGLATANLVFVFTNHFLVGLVVKLARGQSFAESGVFELLTLSLDLSILSLGTATALAWAYNPFSALLTILPLVLLYQALRLPALGAADEGNEYSEEQIPLSDMNRDPLSRIIV